MSGRSSKTHAASRFALALPGIAAACAGDLLQPKEPDPTAEVRVEMKVAHGLPLVEVRLPGDHRAWFLIDTSAGDLTVMDEKLSSELKLKHDLVHDPNLPSATLQAVVPFIEVDGMGRKEITVYVTDVANRSDVQDAGVPVRGVLGVGFFRGHCLELDVVHGEFTATRPRVHRAREVPIALQYAAGGDLHATVKLNGANAVAAIDTSAARTLVTKEFADQAGLKIDPKAPAVRMETALGMASVRECVVERLSLGTEELKDVAVLVIERQLPHVDLLLGTDLLFRYGVIFDLADAPYLFLDASLGPARPKQ